jgi:isopenicillin-N N-acyltransferase like protein
MNDTWQAAFEKLYPWRGRIPVIEVAGGPYDMGREYGQQTDLLVKKVVTGFIDGLCQATRTERARIAAEAHQYEAAIQRITGTQYIEEMHGLADGAGVSYEDILVLNCGWDLLNSLPTPQTHSDYMCSSLSAWGGATTGGQVVCGHNDDGGRYIDEFLVLLKGRPADGHAFVVPLVPGYLGYHRMWNDQGVVLLGLSLEDGCTDDEFEHNLPMWILLRHLAQTCGTTPDVVEALRGAPPATAFNFLFADRSGESRIVEATARHQVVIEAQPGTQDLVLTNHALVDSIKPVLVPRDHPSSTDYRYETVRRLLTQARGTVSLETAKTILSSHYDASVGRVNPSLNSPCRHGEYEGKLSGTVSTVAIEVHADRVEAEISLGNPCEGRWRHDTLALAV